MCNILIRYLSDKLLSQGVPESSLTTREGSSVQLRSHGFWVPAEVRKRGGPRDGYSLPVPAAAAALLVLSAEC